jgi:hypothetical protein
MNEQKQETPQAAPKDDFAIVDRPVAANPETENTLSERDIMEVLLSGKTIQKVLKTSRGDFTALYPLGRERLKMDQIRAIRRRGIPADAFDEFANYNNNVWSTLDVVIVDGPEWYKTVKKQNPSWSWEDGPDEEFVVELFDLVRSFRSDIAEKIRRSNLGKPAGTGIPPAVEPTVDAGAFSGLAY